MFVYRRYEPIGFLERFWSAQALAARAKRTTLDDAKIVALVEAMLSDQESSKGVYMYNMHGMLLQLAETHLRHAEFERATQLCNDAALLNPLDEGQFLTLAKIHK